MANVRVFVSYSSHDRGLVEPVVRLLRANESLVFFDWNDISPGRLWRDSIKTALETVELVALFWCAHSSKSSEVEWEYKSALELGKRLLPILLDSTPLPPMLAVWQAIDFRPLSGKTHDDPKMRIDIPPGYVGADIGHDLFYLSAEQEAASQALFTEMAAVLSQRMSSS